MSTSNDYPAWGTGIAREAAAMMNDTKLYQELKKPLADSIKAAEAAEETLASAKPEAMLAKVARGLGTECRNQQSPSTGPRK